MLSCAFTRHASRRSAPGLQQLPRRRPRRGCGIHGRCGIQRRAVERQRAVACQVAVVWRRRVHACPMKDEVEPQKDAAAGTEGGKEGCVLLRQLAGVLRLQHRPQRRPGRRRLRRAGTASRHQASATTASMLLCCAVLCCAVLCCAMLCSHWVPHDQIADHVQHLNPAPSQANQQRRGAAHGSRACKAGPRERRRRGRWGCPTRRIAGCAAQSCSGLLAPTRTGCASPTACRQTRFWCPPDGAARQVTGEET